jgi:hypothetical protein
MTRGRPKGQMNDNQSHCPLGDLIRKSRIQKKRRLAEVATAWECSILFISNIEQGRAPSPSEKVTLLSSTLKSLSMNFMEPT